jgi:predicted chitinase
MAKGINGGDNGLQERTALIQTARMILCSKPTV